MPLASYFMECEMTCEMPVVILRPFQNGGNVIREGAFSSFSASFNIKEMLICNPILDISSFDCSLIGRTQVIKS